MTRLSFIFSFCFIAYSINAIEIGYDQPISSLASALIVGTDSNGKTLFLCRTDYWGDQQVGVTWAGASQCSISYKGTVQSVTQYTIPNQNEFGHYMWAATTEKAISVGKDANGEPLFLCQANINGYLLPGVSRPNSNSCTIIYQNKVVITRLSKVLSTM